jgi:O-methyltransferase
MKKQKLYASRLKTAIFQFFFSPIYFLFNFIYKLSIIMIVCPLVDTKIESKKYRNTHDYVRCRTLGLLADEVKKKLTQADYAIAEVGVFRGDFAARIQEEFLDKQFYLFDTFEGFPKIDKELDLKMGLSKNDAYELGDFDWTSVDLVLSKMRNPDNCHICRGYFPNTLTELHKGLSWGFVSLDVDLYKPTLEALRFFYPALLPGGYMLVHDFNNIYFSGVKQAIEEYEAEIGTLAKVPIPDTSGSIIITKGYYSSYFNRTTTRDI